MESRRYSEIARLRRFLERPAPTKDGFHRFISQTGAAAAGVIIRNSRGSSVLTAWRVLFQCRDAEEVEAAACQEGIRLAARWTDRGMIQETDCLSVLLKLWSGGFDRSLVAEAPIIADALQESQQLQRVSTVFH